MVCVIAAKDRESETKGGVSSASLYATREFWTGCG